MIQWYDGLTDNIINRLQQSGKPFRQCFIDTLTQTLKVCIQLCFGLLCTRQYLKVVHK